MPKLKLTDKLFFSRRGQAPFPFHDKTEIHVKVSDMRGKEGEQEITSFE